MVVTDPVPETLKTSFQAEKPLYKLWLERILVFYPGAAHVV